MKLWAYSPITGFWNFIREVTPETAQEWLAVWQKAEPSREFKLSKNRPRRKPYFWEETP